MRTTLPLSAATAVVMALSCSSGGPALCAGSETIPQQTVNVGETASVETCFEHTGGGTLSYSASSGDASIVDASIRVSSTVAFRGVSPGQTAVTVTATDEGDMSENVEFQVLVPNRPPTGSMADMTLPVGVDPMIDLATTYTDPDDQELTYTASSSSSAVASVAVTGSSLTLRTAGQGLATVTVTASDGEAEHTDMFDVTAEPALVSDDFASAASLDDWVLGDDVSATIEDSHMVLRSADGNGFAVQPLGGVASDVTVDVALRPDPQGLAGFAVYTGVDAYPIYVFLVGEADLGLGSFDWHFAWLNAEADQPGWRADPDWSLGTSDEIVDDVTAVVSLSLTEDDGLSVMLNGNEIIAPRIVSQLSATAIGLGLVTWPKETGQTNREWVSRMGWIGLRAEDFIDGDPPQAYKRFDFGELKIKRIQQHK